MALGAAPLPAIGILYETSNAEPGLFYVIGPRRYGYDPFPVTHATFLLVGRKLVAEHGTFTLTGQDATLSVPSQLSLAIAGPLPSIALAMADTDDYMYASTGLFTVNGQPVTFRRGWALAAEYGSYTVQGAPAERDMELDAAAGYFTVAGQSADLRPARKLFADYGTFILTGGVSSGTVENVQDRRLTANVGYFVVSGQDTGPAHYTMICDTGAYSVLGGSPILDGPYWSPVAPAATSWDDVAETSTTWADA